MTQVETFVIEMNQKWRKDFAISKGLYLRTVSAFTFAKNDIKFLEFLKKDITLCV